MNMGTKIGGSFGILLLLMLIIGGVAIRGMSDSCTTSAEIANDDVPRLANENSMQSSLLQMAFHFRGYFDTLNEKEFQLGQSYLEQLRHELAELEKLNARAASESTAAFLSALRQTVPQYEESVRKSRELRLRVEDDFRKMIDAGHTALQKYEELIRGLSGSQQELIDTGNLVAASEYSRHMVQVDEIHSRTGTALERLIIGILREDAALFASAREDVGKIRQDVAGTRTALGRPEITSILDAALAAQDGFASHADKLSADMLAVAAEERRRMDLYQDVVQRAEVEIGRTAQDSIDLVQGAESDLRTSRTLIIVSLLVVLVIGCVIAFVVTRMIVNPVRRTQAFARAVADGKMDSRLDVHGADEMGRLADDLRSMVESLRRSIEESRRQSEEARRASAAAQQAIARAEEAARQAESAKRDGMLAAAEQLESVVNAISTASSQLSAQVEESDNNARNAAGRLTEAATAMNEMNSTVQEVARNASSTAQMSADTKQQAVDGAEIVRLSLESTERVHKVSLALKDDMSELNKHAESISNIMNVISDIADQTNLLALNAAIEAARAGEAGRGFAVVADEVRKLAEKTMTSTNEVGTAIKAIQESTSKSVRSVESAVEQIAHAAELAQRSGHALEGIVSNADSTADQVRAIATASEEQSAASEEINQSIEEVNSISTSLAQAMNQSATAITSLADQARNLSRLVEDMKKA